MQKQFLLYLVPLVLFAGLCLPQLEQGDWRRDSPRYAAAGLYLFESGEFFAPFLGPDEPYFNKPPLALWIHGAVLKCFGPTIWASRLPSVVAALGCLALSMACARQLGSRAEAATSGLLLAVSYEFFRRSKEVSLDFWQLLFLLAACYAFIRAAGPRPLRWLVAAGVAVGLGLLCKPFNSLLAVVLGALTLLLLGVPRRAGLSLLTSLPVALAVAAPWHLYMWHRFGDVFIDQYLGRQVVDRASGKLHYEGEGFFYYLTLSEWALPAYLLAGFGLWKLARTRPRRAAPNRRRALVPVALLWFGVSFVALGIFPDKKPNYGLPLWPFLSWLGAFGMCRVDAAWMRRFYRAGFAARRVVPTVVTIALLIQFFPFKAQRRNEDGWAEVFAFLQGGEIPVDRVAVVGGQANDPCVYYLKTGSWPVARGSAAHVIYRAPKRSKDRKKEFTPPGPPIFESGRITLYRNDGR